MNNERSRETEDFKKARVGSAALQVCHTCGSTMGVLVKTKGAADTPEYRGPRNIALEGEYCEFCWFLNSWFAQEGKEEGVRYGAAKVVGEGGELIAFVPFSDKEDRSGNLADGTSFEFKHAMVIRSEKEDGGFKIVEIIEEGV